MQISFTKEIFIASLALNYNCRLFDKWPITGLIFREVHILVTIVISLLRSYRLAFGGIYRLQKSLSSPSPNLAGRGLTFSRPTCTSMLCENYEARNLNMIDAMHNFYCFEECVGTG